MCAFGKSDEYIVICCRHTMGTKIVVTDYVNVVTYFLVLNVQTPGVPITPWRVITIDNIILVE